MSTIKTLTALDAGETVGPAGVPHALVLELEGVAVPTRQVIFSTLKAALSAHDVKFGMPEMMRYGLHAVPAHMMNDLTEHLSLKASVRTAVLAKVDKALADFFRSREVALASGLDRVLDAARGRGAVVGLISWQPEDAARALMEKCGLTRWDPQLACHVEPNHEFPGADVWLKSLKAIGCSSAVCTALVGSRSSCRSALAAGLRCIVVPDEFTAFEDFGGADCCRDKFADVHIEDLGNPG